MSKAYYSSLSESTQSRVIGIEEVEEKSSHYGLYILGFTCATRVKTIRRNSVN